MEDLWDLDVEHAKRRLTWWWWFWLFFLDERPEPRQFMVLWSTKNCRKIRVDDQWWTPKEGIKKKEDGLVFDGMAASWFFDGSTMVDPITLVKDQFDVARTASGGELLHQNPGEQRHIFSGDNEQYRVLVGNSDFEIDVVSNGAESLLGHSYSTNSYPMGMSFEITKLRRMRFSGTLKYKGKDEEITGGSYFQKVTVNAPAIPWFWGTIFLEDGSYLQYFMPHWGLPFLRRTKKERSIFNRGFRPASRSIEFFDKTTGEFHRMKDLKVKRSEGEKGPGFRITGGQDGKEIEFTLSAYSRGLWSFRQTLFGPLATVLYYNEYPVTLTDFRFKDGDRRIGIEDVGGGVGNAEHAWGFLF